jgi:outer membrane protein assembly factor BamB
MGDSVLCVDPESEEVLWKRAFGPPGRGKDEKHQQVELLDAIVTPPALVNHKVFVGTAHGAIVCLSAAKGKMLWTATVQGSIAFQPAVAEGRVYVSTESGTLYCLETGDAQDDGWLMWGANAAHTGRAGP